MSVPLRPTGSISPRVSLHRGDDADPGVSGSLGAGVGLTHPGGYGSYHPRLPRSRSSKGITDVRPGGKDDPLRAVVERHARRGAQ